MLNQDHPKISGRIQMGVDIARKTMKDGEPFVLEVRKIPFQNSIILYIS